MISVCGVAQESIAGEPRNSVTTGRSCARRAVLVLNRAHVVLRRLEQRLANCQVSVERSRRRVAATRQLLNSSPGTSHDFRLRR